MNPRHRALLSRISGQALATSLLVATLLLLGTVTAQAAESQEPAPVLWDRTTLTPKARQAALILNDLRLEAGLPPLAVHPLLNLAVNRHIHDMVTNGHYGHAGSDGSNVHQRIGRTGYEIDGWAGENWAVYADVETSIDWWMADPPHRDNVLNRYYTEMGIGTHPHPGGWGLILVVDFATGSTNQGPGTQVVADPSATVSQNAAPNTAASAGTHYTVQAGDTLSAIGQRHGLSWEAIAQANGLDAGAILPMGARLVIPGVEEHASPDPPTLAPDPTPINSDETVYVVVAGDTLSSIAQAHGLAWTEVARQNGLSPDSILQIGDRLLLAKGDEAIPSAPTHVVQSGETLWSIAAAYSVDWFALLAVNGFDRETMLSVGQEIRLPH